MSDSPVQGAADLVRGVDVRLVPFRFLTVSMCWAFITSTHYLHGVRVLYSPKTPCPLFRFSADQDERKREAKLHETNLTIPVFASPILALTLLSC